MHFACKSRKFVRNVTKRNPLWRISGWLAPSCEGRTSANTKTKKEKKIKEKPSRCYTHKIRILPRRVYTRIWLYLHINKIKIKEPKQNKSGASKPNIYLLHHTIRQREVAWGENVGVVCKRIRAMYYQTAVSAAAG